MPRLEGRLRTSSKPSTRRTMKQAEYHTTTTQELGFQVTPPASIVFTPLCMTATSRTVLHHVSQLNWSQEHDKDITVLQCIQQNSTQINMWWNEQVCITDVQLTNLFTQLLQAADCFTGESLLIYPHALKVLAE